MPSIMKASVLAQAMAVMALVSSIPAQGLVAMEAAAKEGRYLFVFFYKQEDQKTKQLRQVFDTALAKVKDRAKTVAVAIKDPEEKAIVDKFKVSRAPMPLVLALAPNGAVTKGLPLKFSEEQLLACFVGPAMAKSMKALQDGKYVVLCVQNKETEANDAALAGVKGFAAAKAFAGKVVTVMVDPADAAEAETLKTFKVDTKSKKALTLLLAPPGKVVVRFTGGTKKAKFIAALEDVDCCPGGI